MSWLLRGCPKCHGDVEVSCRGNTIFRECLQCGWSSEEYIPAPEKPIVSPEQARYQTIGAMYAQQLAVETIKAMMFVSDRTLWRAVSHAGTGTQRRSLTSNAS